MDIGKDKPNNKIISMLLKACVESAAQPPIITPHFTIRSQFHILVSMPFGTGKSSLAGCIPNSHTTLNYTLPSIVGTINKDGEFINSAIVNSANKIFIIDEGHRLSTKCVDALLSLLEQGFYSRNLGYKIKNPKKQGSMKRSGWEIRPNKTHNGFNISVQFSCLWLGERLLGYHGHAFLSRFYPLIIMPTETDIDNYLMGEGFLDCDVTGTYKKYDKPCKIDKENFDYLTKEFIRISKNFHFSDIEQGYRVRARGQILKLSAHFARLQGNLLITRKDCENALLFADICLLNYKLINLTPLELKIFSLARLGSYTHEEIANILSISRPAVSSYFSRLKEKHILFLHPLSTKT